MCPFFPCQVGRYHWGFPDPAKFVGTYDQIVEEFRRVRDDMAVVFKSYGKDLAEGRVIPTLDPSAENDETA